MPEVRPKFLEYLDDAVRMHGFCVVAVDVAFQLRPDLWATRLNCGADFSTDREALTRIAVRRGAELLEVSLAGMDRRVPLLAMSEHMLAERIEWITGRRATAILPLSDPEVKVRVAPAAVADEPPRYACEARRRWFDARGLKDPLASDRERKPLPFHHF